MLRTKTVEEASKRWMENSIRANPDRIHGIIRAYFEDRQSLKWAVGLLKTEDEKLVEWIVSPYQRWYTEKCVQLTSALKEVE